MRSSAQLILTLYVLITSSRKITDRGYIRSVGLGFEAKHISTLPSNVSKVYRHEEGSNTPFLLYPQHFEYGTRKAGWTVAPWRTTRQANNIQQWP